MRLYNYRMRWLDPQAGRFTTRDPLGAFYDPWAAGNPYTYVGNSPWQWIDSTGACGRRPKFHPDSGYVPGLDILDGGDIPSRAGGLVPDIVMHSPVAADIHPYVEGATAFYGGLLGQDFSDSYDPCSAINQALNVAGNPIPLAIANAIVGLSLEGKKAEAQEADKASTIAKNAKRGAQFEKDVRDYYGLDRNTDRVYGSYQGAERYGYPDLKTPWGYVEIKDARFLYNGRQFHVYAQAAYRDGWKLDLIVSPRTVWVSKNLIKSIKDTGGDIWIFDDILRILRPYY